MPSSSRAERYRATAARLRQLAHRMRSPDSRLQTLGLSQKYERLADYAELPEAPPASTAAESRQFRRTS